MAERYDQARADRGCRERRLIKGGYPLPPRKRRVKNKIVVASAGNWWTSCQNNATNAVKLNNGGFNNNNKTNSNNVFCAYEIMSNREWCSIGDVYAAYLDCKKRKSKSIHYAQFAANEAANIYDLWKDLNERTYTIGYSDAFCVTRPKVREVFAAQFRDRIVHHLVMLRLLPIFEAAFINDTYNCRVGKGTDYGIRRVARFMEKHPQGWVLKCDIKCFFMTIDKQRLADMLARFIAERYQGEDKEPIQWLVRMIVLHRPELRCIRKGDVHLWDVLPAGKTLFGTGGKTGLAIGNLTSQIFANYYLLPLDQWLANVPGVEYGRYVDDFVLIADSVDRLKGLLPQIRTFLRERLAIELHPSKVYLQPVRHGVKFLGSAIKQGRIYAGNRTVGNIKTLVSEYAEIRNKERYIEKFAQRYNSYMGYLIHRNTYGIRWAVWNMVDEQTRKYVYLAGNLAVMQVRSEYKERNKLLKQYSHGKKNFCRKRLRRGEPRVC